ncbi:peroxiredoxin family protein [Flavobacterium oncorhynchi]|uniref:peroxiredoxin family protein n=1 Tax=Flavobacterium oncorhynchi TaxID=728056 RepID=UPI003519DB19
MKKSFKIIITLLLTGTLFFLGYQITSKINHKKQILQNIKTIPKYSYKNINGGTFSNENLKKATPTIFIYFNTECEYCNEEASMIHENIDSFRDFQLIFVSYEPLYKIKKFAQNYKLIQYDNVHFLHDYKVTFATTFDVSLLPCLILYDKNQNLIEKVKGQIKPAILIKKLNLEQSQ